MNSGAFGENFPYSNFHDLNMDWIIKIAKDFLDQYTHLQELITNGEESLTSLTETGTTQLTELTTSGLTQLQEKADNLESLLQEWYDTHSNDIATQLANALSDLNSWYTEHVNFLNTYVAQEIASFQDDARAYGQEVIDSIPADYTALGEAVNGLKSVLKAYSDVLYENMIQNEESIISSTYTLDNYYIADNHHVGQYNATRLKYYPVIAGHAYRIKGTAYQIENYVAAVVEDTQAFTILSAEYHAIVNRDFYNIDEFIVSPITGYLIISEFKQYADTNYLSVYDLDLIGNIKYSALSDEIKNNLIVSKGTQQAYFRFNNGYYINTDGTIAQIGNTNFMVKWYPIKKGETAYLTGLTRLIGTVYPLATFGTREMVYDTIIIDGTYGDQLRQYDVIFTAPDNGFIQIAIWNDPTYGELECWNPVFIANNSIHAKEADNGITALTIKVQAFGDSLTDNEHNTWTGHTTWLDYIDDVKTPHYNLTLQNSSYGGAPLSGESNQYSVVNRVHTLLDTTADAYIIWAGTNDWAGGNVEIGTLQSANNTIKGAVKDIIEYISARTDAYIIFATPTQRYHAGVDPERPVNANGEPLNALGYTLKDVCDAIKEVCDFYGVKCMRFDEMAGFNRINIKYATGNEGLHFSTPEANRRLASFFISAIHDAMFN